MYLLVASGHLGLLAIHSGLGSSSGGQFFISLAVVEAALAIEAAVYALGALGRAGNLMAKALTVLGRVRLLGAAMAWPWLLPWAAELSCRCGAVQPSFGEGLTRNSAFVAALITGFFLLREVSFLVVGEPDSSIAGEVPATCSAAQVSDCMPGQAVLGGQFRLDKADLEETGRMISVPARERRGLYVGAGLALLGHLIGGAAMARSIGFPPWLLLGAIFAFLGRRWGELPKFRPKSEDTHLFSPWRREGPRLTCRFGELLWIACCVMELQRCEAMPSWLSICQAD